MVWMQYIVSLAALFGIVTALTVGLFSLSRIVMAASRDWLLPPFLARISPRTQTPLVAQMVFGVIIGGLRVLNLMSVHAKFACCSAANLPRCPCTLLPRSTAGHACGGGCGYQPGVVWHPDHSVDGLQCPAVQEVHPRSPDALH
jgi:hypothetical protein